jgi:hypothetical protein
MNVLVRLLRPIRGAWKSLWAGAEMGRGGTAAPPNPYLSQAPSSGDIDADSRGQGKISS